MSPLQTILHDGDCYEIPPGRWDVLLRIHGWQATERPTGLDFPFVHQLIECDGIVHCLGENNRWAVGSIEQGAFRTLKVPLPRTEQGLTLARSEHYGMVGWFSQAKNGPFAENFNVYRIEFAKPAGK